MIGDEGLPIRPPEGPPPHSAKTAENGESAEFGGYVLERVLGEGSMGRVYLARDPRLGRRIAIKILHPELCEQPRARHRFLREARVMARLDHPNVVRVFASGEIDTQLFFVMEYVAGESLSHRIWSAAPLPLEEACRIVLESTAALEAAWTLGIVHRDVKPTNILLDSSGRVHVADFGLAKPTAWDDGITLPNRPALTGTPLYVAPEIVLGARRIDFRCDLYSLGLVFYEMLTGKRPFVAHDALSAAVQHAASPLPDPRRYRPDLDEETVALLASMSARRRCNRPASHAALRERIEAAIARHASTPRGAHDPTD